MISNFPFKIEKGYFSELLLQKSIDNDVELRNWLRNIKLDSDANDSTELNILEQEIASNIAKNAFFARVSIENGVDKNRFFVGFAMLNARIVPEMEEALADLPNQALPIVLGFLKCGDERVTVGNDQHILDLLGKFIVREHHVDPHQGFEWRQMMYDDYLTRYIDRNQLSQSLEELKQLKDQFFELYLNK